MKRLGTWLVLLISLGAFAQSQGDRLLDQRISIQILNGTPDYLGTINTQDGGTQTNFTTNTMDGGLLVDGGWVNSGAFDAGFGSMLAVQCAGDHRLASGTYVGGFNAMFVPMDSRTQFSAPFYIWLSSNSATLAAKPVTIDGGTYCNLYRLK